MRGKFKNSITKILYDFIIWKKIKGTDRPVYLQDIYK